MIDQEVQGVIARLNWLRSVIENLGLGDDDSKSTLKRHSSLLCRELDIVIDAIEKWIEDGD